MDELFQDLSSELETSRHRLRAGNAAIPALLAEHLRHDDRLLSKLERFPVGLKSFDGSKRELTARSRISCKKLATYVADGIRCRLDRVYLEASRSRGKSWVTTDDTDLTSSVEEEMNSLYSEIAAVAEMSVNCEFEIPLLSQFRHKQTQDAEYTASVLDFVSVCKHHKKLKDSFMIA